jgi:hypothetical protein
VNTGKSGPFSWAQLVSGNAARNAERLVEVIERAARSTIEHQDLLDASPPADTVGP